MRQQVQPMSGIALKGGRPSDTGMAGVLRIAAVAMLALAAGALWLRAHDGDAPVPAGASQSLARASAADGGAGRSAPPEPSAPAAAVAPAGAVGASRIDPAALRLEFERAPDLYALAAALAPAARAGDPEALWISSRIHDYCAGYATSPAGYVRDTAVLDGLNLPGAVAMGRARDRVASRCGRFAPSDGLTVATILHQREEAAEAGHLAAEASLLAMGAPLDDSPEYKRDLVERVRSSGDAEAYSALSPGMGVAASGDRAFSDTVAGTQFAEIAWQIAACRNGLDCGPGSAIMTQYCANGGICSRDPEQDFQSFVYDAAIPRQGAEQVDGMVETLLQGVSERVER